MMGKKNHSMTLLLNDEEKKYLDDMSKKTRMKKSYLLRMGMYCLGKCLERGQVDMVPRPMLMELWR